MSYFAKEIDTIFSKVEAYDSIVIFGHRNPDGDCLGSVQGLKNALKALFPEKKVYGVGSIPNYLSALFAPSDEVSDEVIENSLAFMVDLSDLDRVEDQRILKAKEIVCIDHHQPKEVEVDFPIVRDIASISASTIIAKCLIERYRYIPKEAAKYLFIGLITDSGRFQFSSSPDTLLIAARMVQEGQFDAKEEIYDTLYAQRSSDLRYKSFLYANFAFYGLVTYVCVRRQDYESLGLSQNEASGQVNLLSLLDGHPMWAQFTEQEDGTIRCELRSNTHYNVQKVAIQFGGGGHIPASGCKLKSFDQVEDVLKAMNEAEKI